MTLSRSHDHLLKFLLVGDADVGKNEILQKLADVEIDPPFSANGVSFKTTAILLDGKRIKLQLWETSGQGRFNTIIRSYSRGAEGVLLVYDITNRWSFDGISRWVTEIAEQAPGVPKILIGNRLHLEFKRAVPREQAQAFAAKYGMEYFEVSSLVDFNIHESLAELTRLVLRRSRMEWLLKPNKVGLLQDICCRSIINSISTVYDIDTLPLPSLIRIQLRSFADSSLLASSSAKTGRLPTTAAGAARHQKSASRSLSINGGHHNRDHMNNNEGCVCQCDSSTPQQHVVNNSNGLPVGVATTSSTIGPCGSNGLSTPIAHKMSRKSKKSKKNHTHHQLPSSDTKLLDKTSGHDHQNGPTSPGALSDINGNNIVIKHSRDCPSHSRNRSDGGGSGFGCAGSSGKKVRHKLHTLAAGRPTVSQLWGSIRVRGDASATTDSRQRTLTLPASLPTRDDTSDSTDDHENGRATQYPSTPPPLLPSNYNGNYNYYNYAHYQSTAGSNANSHHNQGATNLTLAPGVGNTSFSSDAGRYSVDNEGDGGKHCSVM